MGLFYRKFGTGPPLIILHGLYGSSDNWVSIGKKLAAKFEVYLIDQRNHGQSFHSDQHRYDLLQNDLKKFLEEQSISKAIIIGHSMGGKTATYFAVENPEMIQSLIVIDIAPTAYQETKSEQHKIHSIIIESLLQLDIKNQTNREDINDQLRLKLPNDQLRNFLLKNLKRNNSNGFQWKINLPVLKTELPYIMSGLDPADFMYGNPVVGFPVMFIKGGNSPYISRKDLEDIQKIFPQAIINTIDNAGHWLHAEKPEELIQIITEFIWEN